MCFSGCAILDTEESRLPILPGTITVVRSERSHRIDIIRLPYRRWLLHFDPDAFRIVSPLKNLRNYAQFTAFPSQDVSIATAFKRLLANVDKHPTTGQETLHRSIADMLHSVVSYPRHKELPRARSDLYLNEVVRPVIELIHENRYQISVHKIAAHLGYSESHVRRVFRQMTGMSISAYSRIQRLADAQRLLRPRTRELIVSDVAYRLGFRDIAHFSQYFKKHTGYCPTEYRTSV